ncbi:hypothetical protein ACES2L_06005 [Bdellovibrio bacteriovorus]
MGYDPFHDPDLEAAKKKQLQKRQKELEDLKKVLNTEEGFNVLSKIIDSTKYFDSSMTGNSHTFFNEGMREVGKLIWKDIAEADRTFFQKYFDRHFKIS